MAPIIPTWVVWIYYTALILTIAASVQMLRQRSMVAYSILTLLFVPLFVVINIVGAISRSNRNELEFWFTSLLSFEIWAWLSFSLFIYFIIWWYKVLRDHF